MATVLARPSLPTLTEALAQEALERHSRRKKHDLAIPNCAQLFGWESDLASVTRRGMTHDFEIKVTRADWLREIRARGEVKTSRHETLCTANAQAAERLRRPTQNSVRLPPNYWWVAAPEGVVGDGELPDYAGQILLRPSGKRWVADEIVPAPCLHRHPLPHGPLRALARGLSVRYWKQRSGL